MRSMPTETELWVDLNRDFKAEKVKEMMNQTLQLIRHLTTTLGKFLSLADE